MNTVAEIKTKIEKETGLKVSVKVNSLSSSMRGYVTFTTKKQKGQFTEWGYGYRKDLQKQFEMPEPNPTFCNNYQLSVYFGNQAYNN